MSMDIVDLSGVWTPLSETQTPEMLVMAERLGLTGLLGVSWIRHRLRFADATIFLDEEMRKGRWNSEPRHRGPRQVTE